MNLFIDTKRLKKKKLIAGVWTTKQWTTERAAGRWTNDFTSSPKNKRADRNVPFLESWENSPQMAVDWLFFPFLSFSFLFLKPLRASICPSSSAHGALTVAKSPSGPAVFPLVARWLAHCASQQARLRCPLAPRERRMLRQTWRAGRPLAGNSIGCCFGGMKFSRERRCCLVASSRDVSNFYHQTPFKISLFLQVKYWGICLVR